MKGQSDTSFILGLVIFLTFIVFLGGMMTALSPGFIMLTDLDITYISTEAVSVAAACVIITGGVCAITLAGFSIFGFFIISNSLLNILIILPCTVVLAFVMAKLARGSGG